MKQLDEDERGGYRGVIERELSERLSKRGATSPSPGPSAVAAQDGRCNSCGTTNDADALFCKRCGSKLHLAGAER
jgi:hypothetical protein